MAKRKTNDELAASAMASSSPKKKTSRKKASKKSTTKKGGRKKAITKRVAKRVAKDPLSELKHSAGVVKRAKAMIADAECGSRSLARKRR